MKRLITGIFLLGYTVSCLALTPPKPIKPADVYHVMQQQNHTADRLLKHQKLKVTPLTIPDYQHIRPAFVFQLHIATIELLHAYELQLGLRPIPIVTSSPINYIPEDVKFLADLIRHEMSKITQHYALKHLAQPVVTKKSIQPKDVFASCMQFYLKLNMLANKHNIDANNIFTQVYRIEQEIRDIAYYKAGLSKNKRQKRRILASLFGSDPYSTANLMPISKPQSLSDNLKRAKQLRHLISGKTLATTSPSNAVTLFVQTQVILAELGDWKRKHHIASSTPVSAQVKGKTQQDIANQLASSIYMFERLK